METVSDETLAARAAALRDPESFGMLVARHQSKVRGYLRQLSRDPATADDLAQEAFIRAWDRLDTFSSKGSFLSWLMTIAHRQFLQSIRKNNRVRRLAEELQVRSSIEDEPDAGRPTDEGDLADLPRLLSALSETERMVLVLSCAYGMSHAEISEVTGLALGTVKSHIHRGKERVRKRFRLEQTDEA